jgi:hypothetical protein
MEEEEYLKKFRADNNLQAGANHEYIFDDLFSNINNETYPMNDTFRTVETEVNQLGKFSSMNSMMQSEISMTELRK